MKTTKKLIAFLCAFSAIIVFSGCTSNEDTDSNETYIIIRQEKLKERILSDPNTFFQSFSRTEQDSSGLHITNSPDGNLKVYTFEDYDNINYFQNIYQTRHYNKIKTFDWNDEAFYVHSIRQIESADNAIYLIFSGTDRYSTVSAFKINRFGELIPANIFTNTDYDDNDDIDENAEGTQNLITVERINIESPSLFAKNGWDECFFFDLTGADIYIPIITCLDEFDPRYEFYGGYISFKDYYKQLHWNGEKFEYIKETYNPALIKFIEPAERIADEFVYKRSIIRIDQMGDRTYRYLAWKQDKMISKKPDLIIEKGWYHEVEGQYHFTNKEYEYIYNDKKRRLIILQRQKNGKTKKIVNCDV